MDPAQAEVGFSGDPHKDASLIDMNQQEAFSTRPAMVGIVRDKLLRGNFQLAGYLSDFFGSKPGLVLLTASSAA
jgi:hypothetical protein